MIFEAISNSKYFANSTISLCFTKMDVFKKKLATGESPIKNVFPGYEGAPADVTAAQTFFAKKFTSLLRNGSVPNVHYLDATNIDDVRNVLAHVFEGQAPLEKIDPAHRRSDSASHVYVSSLLCLY